jgi:hypothetical protein
MKRSSLDVTRRSGQQVVCVGLQCCRSSKKRLTGLWCRPISYQYILSNSESEELRRLRLTEGSSVVDVLQRSTGSRAQQQSAGEFVPLDHRQAKCIQHRLN